MSASSVAEAVARPGFDAAAFEAFLGHRGEPDWVVARRRSAFEQYQAKLAEPLAPEEWKRVDLRAFQPQRFSVAAEASGPATFETLLERT